MSQQVIGATRTSRAPDAATTPAIASADVPPLPAGVRGRSVVARFLDVRTVRDGEPALTDVGGALSYAELDARSADLARRLVARSPGGSAPVGVLTAQGRHAVVGFLGVLRAGRAAVLLDPHLPDDRLVAALRSTSADLLVADPTTHERATGVADATGATVVAARTDASSLPAPGPTSLPTPPGGPDAATIIFTSGSTGRPKGVVLSHDAVVNGAAIAGDAFAITPDDGVALVLPVAFAAGQETLWTGLLHGATVHLHDPRSHGLRGFPAWLEERGVTTLHATPSLLRSVVGVLDGAHERVRLVTTCGEPVHGRDVAAVRPHAPHATFVSWLGASEIGHLAFHHVGPDEPVPDGVVPVGRPVPTKEVRVLDESGVPVTAGTLGAVEVRSAFLATGYWDDGAATREKFAAGPDGTVRVRTGDLGRLAPDGTLHLAGRADRAVKIRGYLVEPAEVEAALRSVPEVVDAAVVVAGVDAGARLVAYAVPDGRRRTPSLAAVRRHVRAALPEWMVPAQIVLLAELPRTERGKVDRAALPEPPTLPTPTPPADQWEVTVAEIWSTVLDTTVGRESVFATLGGDSLAVEEMLAMLEEQLGVALVPNDLAEHPSLAELAALVAVRVTGTATPGSTRRRSRVGRSGARRPARRSSAPVVRLRTGEGPAVLCFSGAGGSASLFAGFAAELATPHPVHAFAVNGFENRGIPDWTVAATARRYLRLMDEIGPEAARPAALVGHSLGGLFALEVARRLRDRGVPVPLVVALDTILPPSVAVDSGDDAPVVRVPGFREQSARERWLTRLQLLGAGLVPYEGETRTSVFFQHGARLTRFHRPAPWEGRTLVFRSLENLDGPHWWDALLTGPHEVVEVPGDHVSVLKPPYLAGVVRRVRAALDEGASPSAVEP